MLGRLPQKSDFPSNLTISIVPPPAGKAATNILILLHGLGDTNTGFTKLGEQLNLPETACLSLQAATPLPFDLGGFHWGDDIVFDQSTGSMELDTGFKASTLVIDEVVLRKGLIENCGYSPRDIMLLGYGQGGMAAFVAAANFSAIESLGGVISIGGPFPLSAVTEKKTKAKTPVLIVGSSSKSLVTSSAVKTIKDVFSDVQVCHWNRIGDGMPRNRDEMMPIMTFFARRLQSQAGVPDGSTEIK